MSPLTSLFRRLPPPAAALVSRAIRFVATGLVGAGVAYLLFIGFLRLMPWPAANGLAWLGSVGFGFVVNRRFTFGVIGAARRSRQAVSYLAGAALQLGLSYAIYAVLLDRLHWKVTPAFVVMTAITAAFGFAYQSLVTFRRPLAAA